MELLEEEMGVAVDGIASRPVPRVSPGCGLEQKAQLRKEGKMGERIEGRGGETKEEREEWVDRQMCERIK